ncbi:MAG: hypothetical protein KOO66_05530 [Bacteroidales bacterium]|nr:hypothetical protein [Bacteroidales bacterium]
MNFKVYFIFLLIVLSGHCFSQSGYSYYTHDYKINPSDSGKLFFEIDNINFIKNNEYFGPVAEGYTLLGFNLSPKIQYFPNSRIKLMAGANLLSYYGRENEINASLLLSFQYKINSNFDFVLGNIYGTNNHRLIEPVFDFERFLNNNIENGIQFLWNSERIFADLWLDWEQQILQGDPFQEIFNVGLSSEFVILKKENQFKLSVPFQNIVRHEGGQINANNEVPLTTLFNNATGLSFQKSIQRKFLHKIIISSYVVSYQDMSPNKQQMYIDGTGFYPTVELVNNSFDFLLGYWYGNQFVAPLGNPVYETYSRTKFFVEEPVRQLVTAKLNYQKDIFKGINLGVRFETYYDILESNLEYTWGVIIVINERFFLKNL